MPSNNNRIIIACAGSGKTTQLVEEALADPNRRIAMVTYTHFNAMEIDKKFSEHNVGIPKHVDLMTWFSFLLRHCARPYQRVKYTDNRIESIMFVKKQSTRHISETNTRHYYFSSDHRIYSDKIAKFVTECEKMSPSAVTNRLAQIYTDLFIDEFQDLAGWDLELIEMLLRSKIRITLVGDPRQHIYSTNPSRKNRQYLGNGIIDLIKNWEEKGLCSVEHKNNSHRCNQAICEFANLLWPGMEPMNSLCSKTIEHCGMFLVAERVVDEYVCRYKPQFLRHDRRSKTYGWGALNFGVSKGLEFKRVLIVPTEPIQKYLQTGLLNYVEKSRDKLYVAVTRALYSVAFVYDGGSAIVPNRWVPG